MALISCPECKSKVSETAKQCPKCGYQLELDEITKLKTRWKEIDKKMQIGCWVIIIIILTILLISFICVAPHFQ